MNNSLPVYLFGDTDHMNTSIKSTIAHELGQLRAQGYTTLAVEVDRSHQAAVDRMPPSLTEAQVCDYVRTELGVKHYNGMGVLLHAALANGMKIACVDAKEHSADLNNRFPEFRDIRRACDATFHAMGDAAEQASLKAFREEQPERFAAYMEAYAAWKDARISVDSTMAAQLAALAHQGEKVVAVLGQSHLARPQGVPAMLNGIGIPTQHVDVYQSMADYEAFMTRSFEMAEAKQPPPAIYVLDQRMSYVMSHPTVPASQIASAAGQTTRLGSTPSLAV